MALHAPHPLLIISSQRGTDNREFPLHEAEKSHQWAQHVYRQLGAEDAITHYESTTAHGYQEDKRRRLYGAVEYWLHPPRSCGDKELATRMESVEDLACGLPANNLTFRDVFAEWVNPLPRANENDAAESSRAFLKARLGWPDTLPDVKANKVGQEERGPWLAEFWIIETEPGIRLPAIPIARQGSASPVTLIPGRDVAAVSRALAADRQALVLDLRGTGKQSMVPAGVGRGWPDRPGPNCWAMRAEA